MPSAKKRKALEQARRRQKRRLWGGVVAVVGAIALVAVIVSVSGSEATAGDQTAPVTVAEAVLPGYEASEPDPAVGMPAPTLQGRSVDGSPLTIDPGSTGSPTAIWFVAHWCPHCQAEVPRIVSLSERGLIPDEVDVYAVSTSVNADAPNYPPSAWLDDVGWPFAAMADDDVSSAGEAYGLGSFPYLVVTDADGNVLGRHQGELGEEGISQTLQRLVAA